MNPEGAKKRKWPHIRRTRSRVRVLLIVAGMILHRATPWTLAVGGGILLLARALQVWAYGHLDKATRSKRGMPPTVTTSGPYAHVRNPIMYGSALSDIGYLTMAGNPILLGIYIITMAPVHIRRVFRLEEPFLRKEFGESYERYARRVPRFLPRLLPHRERDRKSWRLDRVLRNRELSRSLNYLFFGAALILWSDLGAARYLPSWDQIGQAFSRPWAVALLALTGALALLSSALQWRQARLEEGETESKEVGEAPTPG